MNLSITNVLYEWVCLFNVLVGIVEVLKRTLNLVFLFHLSYFQKVSLTKYRNPIYNAIIDVSVGKGECVSSYGRR